MKSIVKLKLVVNEENYPKVDGVLRRFNLQRPWADVLEIPLERDDPRRALLTDELEAIGHEPLTLYENVFEEWEVNQAELLHLHVWLHCGPGFEEWVRDLGLPEGARVIDKREMRNQDIAKTYSWDVIISDRILSILRSEKLTGWKAEPVSHIRPSEDSYPPYFHLTATTELPPLSSMTEVERVIHDRPLRWPPGHPFHGAPDPLYGTTALFVRGPLYYERSRLGSVEDFNRTSEHFGEKPQARPDLLISQRAWRAFQQHRVRDVIVEPVVIQG